jgi:Glyoxalase/Bleomycin resistance protein/Dioxygenase superfamily
VFAAANIGGLTDAVVEERTMRKLNFGQPDTGIFQMAYVVNDIHDAMDHLKVGPWYLLDHFTGLNPVYRGGPSRAGVKLAMSFAGHMNIELIQPSDEHPSVYRELLDTRGPGFHHWGIASRDFGGDIRRYEAEGMTLAFRAGVPTGGEVAYMDTHGRLPGFLELIQMDDLTEKAFTHWYSGALNWDGTDRVRPFM